MVHLTNTRTALSLALVAGLMVPSAGSVAMAQDKAAQLDGDGVDIRCDNCPKKKGRANATAKDLPGEGHVVLVKGAASEDGATAEADATDSVAPANHKTTRSNRRAGAVLGDVGGGDDGDAAEGVLEADPANHNTTRSNRKGGSVAGDGDGNGGTRNPQTGKEILIPE